jgi:uncharacterized UBP type Zn finger protein
MESYEAGVIPRPYGLGNTGTICHFNALLQGLASCSAVVRAALSNRRYLSKTATGQALYDHFAATAPEVAASLGGGAGAERFGGEGAGLAGSSSVLLQALVRDLRQRRPGFRFGPRQESASEGLVLLLDMLDDPAGEENPIARAFYHRYEAQVYCAACKAGVSREQDVAVQFNLFHYDGLPQPPRTPAAFSEMLLAQLSNLDGYRCESCGDRGGGYRHYCLRMIPEVLVCLFNLYDDRRPRRVRYYPSRLHFPGRGGARLAYRQVAQIEHYGQRSGGHYVARGLRGDGRVYCFNDASVAPSSFGPTPNVYMVFYHYEGTEASQ